MKERVFAKNPSELQIIENPNKSLEIDEKQIRIDKNQSKVSNNRLRSMEIQ